jgi:hypothetical protein
MVLVLGFLLLAAFLLAGWRLFRLARRILIGIAILGLSCAISLMKALRPA